MPPVQPIARPPSREMPVATSSSPEPGPDSRKPHSPKLPASPGKPSPTSNAVPQTSPSTSSTRSLGRSGSRLTVCSSHRLPASLTKPNCCAVEIAHVSSSSMHATFTLPSTKPPVGESGYPCTPTTAHLEYCMHRKSLRTCNGGASPIRTSCQRLRKSSSPSRRTHTVSAKRDKLAGTRAAEVFFRGDVWRIVFDVDDDFREVRILAIGEHDAAYRAAERRR